MQPIQPSSASSKPCSTPKEEDKPANSTPPLASVLHSIKPTLTTPLTVTSTGQLASELAENKGIACSDTDKSKPSAPEQAPENLVSQPDTSSMGELKGAEGGEPADSKEEMGAELAAGKTKQIEDKSVGDKGPLDYDLIASQETMRKVQHYLSQLKEDKSKAGQKLSGILKEVDIQKTTPAQLVKHIVATKPPRIFAESEVCGDGSDWNPSELSILGDISVCADVTIYDNGLHTTGSKRPQVHCPSFQGTLLFVPGALLRAHTDEALVDRKEVVKDHRIDKEAFFKLYQRRILPALIHVNRTMEAKGEKAIVTIPGLGCGQFAGEFRGRLGEELKEVLIKLLKENQNQLKSIGAVYYDPYKECQNKRLKIGHMDFLVRPLDFNNPQKPQLCHPATFSEKDNEFDNYKLVSMVAWDHVSWPGNDFYTNQRLTDDGVKAAATSSMASMTKTMGQYNERTFKYEPPKENKNWEEVVKKKALVFGKDEKLFTYDTDANK